MRAMTAFGDVDVDDRFDELKRLRFPNEMHVQESIPGFIARCANDHSVPRLKAVYDEIDFRDRLPGKLQIADEAVLAKVTYVTRSDIRTLKKCVGKQARAKVVAFGDLHIPSEIMEFALRRIAPETLRTQSFHRHDWLNRMLPYCPVSGELLVSRCPRCARNLGWSFAAGIGHCDYCEELVPPSSEPRLPEEHAARYRLFSDLISLGSGLIDRARR